jgi:hypothetical protein
MALIVEDGSCVATANAFVSRAELIAYAADYRPDLTIADDATTDAAVMRASMWLSTFPDWDGEMACGRGSQGLAWPRSDVTDCNDDDVPSDEIPWEIKQATYLAAIAELSSPGVLTPTITPGKQAKREKVDVIEVEYMTPFDQNSKTAPDVVEVLRPVLSAVSDLIKCLGSMPNGSNTPWPWVA